MYKDVFLLLGSGKARKKYKFNILYTPAYTNQGLIGFAAQFAEYHPWGRKFALYLPYCTLKH